MIVNDCWNISRSVAKMKYVYVGQGSSKVKVGQDGKWGHMESHSNHGLYGIKWKSMTKAIDIMN